MSTSRINLQYCICRSSNTSRFMIGCDNCQDWFHGDCVNLTEKESKKIQNYYCQYCRAYNAELQIVYYKADILDSCSNDEAKKEIKPRKRTRRKKSGIAHVVSGGKPVVKRKNSDSSGDVISATNNKKQKPSGRPVGRPFGRKTASAIPSTTSLVNSNPGKPKNRFKVVARVKKRVAKVLNSGIAASENYLPPFLNLNESGLSHVSNDQPNLTQTTDCAIRTNFWVSKTSTHLTNESHMSSRFKRSWKQVLANRQNSGNTPRQSQKKRRRPQNVQLPLVELPDLNHHVTIQEEKTFKKASFSENCPTFPIPELELGESASVRSDDRNQSISPIDDVEAEMKSFSDSSCDSYMTDTASETERNNLIDLKLRSSEIGGGFPIMCSSPGCYRKANVTRFASQYCCDKCYEISSHILVRQRFEMFSIVNFDVVVQQENEEKEKWKDLTDVKLWLERCSQTLQLLGRRRMGLDGYLEDMKGINDSNNGAIDYEVEISDHSDQVITFRCIFCYRGFKLGNFVNHVKHCLKKSQMMHDSNPMIPTFSVVGPKIFCEACFSERPDGCKKLQVLCNRHDSKMRSLGQDKVCGYPISNSDIAFETYDWSLKGWNERDFCRKLRNTCRVHDNWETVMRVDLDTRRTVQFLAVEDLREMEMLLWKGLPNKKPWLEKLLAD